MSLLRYLPTPSDRMAVMWTLLGVKNAVVLEYGPAGTTHYSMSLLGSMKVDTDNRLFTTHMSEDDVVMGDVTRLEESIKEIDENYHPEVIFIVPSAISTVIGTDMRGVCHYMQAYVNARLYALENGGFKGDYTVGLSDAYGLLAANLTEKGETRKNTYNIIGASAGAYRIHSDLAEIESMMYSGFGATRIATVGTETSVEELKNAGQAALNLVIRCEGLPAAMDMEERFGIPYLYHVPYGYQSSLAMLSGVGERLQASPDSAFTAAITKKMRESMQMRMYLRMYEEKPTVSIIGDYDLLHGLSVFMESLGLQLDLRLCAHSLKHVQQPDPGILHLRKEKDRIERLKGLHRQLILGDDVSLHVCADTNTKCCVSFPFVNHTQVGTHLPFMGVRGADFLMETVYAYFKTLN